MEIKRSRGPKHIFWFPNQLYLIPIALGNKLRYLFGDERLYNHLFNVVLEMKTLIVVRLYQLHVDYSLKLCAPVVAYDIAFKRDKYLFADSLF